jgi:subtilisin family serine protease
LAARENPEFDRGGFPTRRGEVISLDLTKDQIKAAKARGFSVIDKVKLPALGLLMVRLRAPRGMKAIDAMSALRSENPETFYELDHYFGITSGGLDGKAGDDMLDMKVSNPRPFTVGMIDTAVWRQATLRSARVDSQDFTQRSGKPPYAHGTAVASILHRQGAVRIVSANVFAADGRPYSSAEAIARAVDWMVERKVPVINISIAGPHNALVDRVIAAATARGHIIVAAAGNGGPAAPAAYPAASPGAVAVTAIDRTGRVYLNANRGDYIDISAIGVAIGAEAPDGSLRPHSGTSFAAPFVAASLARCQSNVDPRRRQDCVKQMEAHARDLGTPGRDPIYGYGLLVP